MHHWLVLQFLHPAFKVPESERDFRKKFVHKNHNKFVRVIVPNNGYRPMECTIPRKYTSREELPLHCLEWWGCRMDNRDLGRNVGQLLENEERDENA